MKYLDLTGKQRRLHDQVEQAALYHGIDCRDLLISLEGAASDKAAVAEVMGGAGAGAEFRREHISKRSECRVCTDDIVFLDGIRNPYWVHADRVGGRHRPDKPIEPNDAHTRRVFEPATKVWRTSD